MGKESKKQPTNRRTGPRGYIPSPHYGANCVFPSDKSAIIRCTTREGKVQPCAGTFAKGTQRRKKKEVTRPQHENALFS